VTALLEDLRAAELEQLAEVYYADEGPTSAAALREVARRDQEARLAAARGALAGIRSEAELAVHAQFLEASEQCRGRLLSREGMAAGIAEAALWRLPEDRAQRHASEELRDFWTFTAPRITSGTYVHAHAAESRAARIEALDLADAGADGITDTDQEGMSDDRYQPDTGPRLADHDSGAFRQVPVAEAAPQDGTGRPLRGGGYRAGRTEASEVAGAATGRPAGHAGPTGRVSATVTAYTTFGEIEPLATEYLLSGYPRIPRGDVTLFYGDGSLGKGRMLWSFIAEVVNSGGTVITVLPEDHPNEQAAVRLRAAGVRDPSKVIDLTRLPGGARLKLSADMTHDGDVGHLRQAVGELTEAGHKVRLLVIDPLAAVVGWGSITTNAGVRRLIEPLQDLAMSTGIAVGVVAHTVKSGVLQGSAGLQQALRLVYKIAKDPANPLLRILHADKANNIVAEDLKFTVEEDDDGLVRVVWLDRAEQDRRNKQWRDPAPEDDAQLASVHHLGAVPAPAPAAPVSITALMSTQAPWEPRLRVQVLARYPDPERGQELARRRCELHPMFRGARWQRGEAGDLLARYVTDDGTTVRFAVAAVTDDNYGNEAAR
jgi:AAA domain